MVAIMRGTKQSILLFAVLVLLVGCAKKVEVTVSVKDDRLGIVLREMRKCAEIGSIRLSIDLNELTTLPPEIGKLTNLKELRLSDNQLIRLPPEIGILTKLESLSVNNNRLNELPPEIGKLRR